MDYRATRSFYGDLGSVRRNQELKIADDRLAKQLLAKKLIVRLDGEADEPKAKQGKRSAKPE